ncbi:MAG: 4Fe-4S dicluster domain-containing protein [Thermodesulfobacteriota bacterium]|jgi:ferredoxin
MDFESFVEGPLLWIVFLMLIIGIITRLVFFFFGIIKSSRDKEYKWIYRLTTLGRSLLPFHNAVIKKPLYAALRYIFHICLIVVPIWFSGHIALWEMSRFEWSWVSLPDAWVDWMTLVLVSLATYFLIRRIVIKDIRTTSSISDFIIIFLTALPFITGYSLTHGSLDSISFLGDNMWTIHMVSGEAMILMAVFLFCKTHLNTQKCTGCAACELNCPTGTLESSEEGNLRIFTYSHYQCICCGACVNTCPEEAADLQHKISLKSFFQIPSKQEIRSVELKACERCGALFAPEPQLDKIGQTFTHEYLRFCPRCRMLNIGDLYHQLSPWHRKELERNN